MENTANVRGLYYRDKRLKAEKKDDTGIAAALWAIAVELAEVNAIGHPMQLVKRSDYPPGAHQCEWEQKRLQLLPDDADGKGVLCNVCVRCGRAERI